MGYVLPTSAPVSDSWYGHKSRNPPSPEPGTDYACEYGTDLAIAEAGTVSVVDTSPGGGEGRTELTTRYQCGVCFEPFTTLHRARAHVESHEGETEPGIIVLEE